MTFDDGPDTDVTPRILTLLKEKKATATFFVLGKKAEAHPELLQQIYSEGHAIGSHGYEHMNGWENPRDRFIENVYKTKGIVPGNLFRPPYGKLTRKIYNDISHDYRVVLWSLLGFDYLKHGSSDACLNHLKRRTRPGNIIVFHDGGNVKFDLVPVVSRFIDYCRERGWEPEKIT